MDNSSLILPPSFFQFIAENQGADSVALRLAYHNKKSTFDFDIELAITQIECRRSTATKLSDTLKCVEFLFPSKLSAEQCTGDVLALWHSQLIGPVTSLADLTGGLCIDAFHAAKLATEVTVCELNSSTAEAARHNCEAIGLHNVRVINTDCIKYLEGCGRKFDVIFIDPARRAADSSRTYALADCEPDVVKYQKLLTDHCSTLIIKASPMLDLTDVLRRMVGVTDIYVASVRNECKEVVIKIKQQSECKPRVRAIDFKADGSEVVLDVDSGGDDHNYNMADLEDLHSCSYLYEPMAAAMKIGHRAFATIAARYPQIKKLGRDTHLFVSTELIADFPGRIFEIKSQLKLKGSDIKRLSGKNINVAVRNYVMTAQQLRSRLKVKDGGDEFVIGTKAGASDTPILLLCKRI